jgi:hypothetical protein
LIGAIFCYTAVPFATVMDNNMLLFTFGIKLPKYSENQLPDYLKSIRNIYYNIYIAVYGA